MCSETCFYLYSYTNPKEIYSYFLFQYQQQQANLERATVQLNNTQTHVAALQDIIGQFRVIVEELVGQENNGQIVSCILSSLYVCIVNTILVWLRKHHINLLLQSFQSVSSDLHQANNTIISTDEDPSLRIESSAIINLRGVSTKLN